MTAWLDVIGIGEDGVSGLGVDARDRLMHAEVIFGGARHLQLLPACSAEQHAWPSPFNALLEQIEACRGRRVCVLASGDPTCFGVGSRLARRFAPADLRIWPSPSAFALARARMLWTFGDVSELTLHGRPLALLQPHVHPDARLIILSWDARTPAQVAGALCERGFGASEVTVLERLGGPAERIRNTTAHAFELDDIDGLNTLAVHCVAGEQAVLRGLTPGLADTDYEHDGQLTKRVVRAATLSALAPEPAQYLWDVGAGAGSVSIEWMLAHPLNRAVAIERDAERATRIRTNADALGVPDLEILTAAAPDALLDLPVPHAIFVGGAVSDERTLAHCVAALRPGGRLVANGVTLEAQAALMARYASLGGSLESIAVSAARAVGDFTLMQPAKTVLQWTWRKPS